MYDLISIGSATLDIVVKSKHFSLAKSSEGVMLCERYGDKMDVEELRFSSGGGATNVAVGASRLGLKTATVCELGKDFASEMIIKELEAEEVDTQLVIQERLETTATSVLLVSSEGGRSALTHRGAAYELESRDMPWEYLSKTRWVHLGSLGGDKELIYDLFEYFKHKEISVSWTPSLKDLDVFSSKSIRTEEINCDLLLLNDTEWKTIEALQDEFLNRINVVFVTKGKHGGDVYLQGNRSKHSHSSNEKRVSYTSIDVDVIEETGAGDSFATGIIVGFLMNRTLEECIEMGKQNSASVIQQLGAKQGLLTKTEMEKRLKNSK